MKKLWILPLVCLAFLTSCKENVQGEGDAQMAVDFKVETFTDVDAKGKFKLIVIPNDSAYVSVQSHRNLIENVDLYVKNNELVIKESKPVDSFESYVIYLYYNQRLNDIEIGDKVLLESSAELFFDQLDIKAKDESIVQQFVINAKEVDFTVEDKAELDISGSATTVDLKAKDFAKVFIEALDVKVLDVDLAGEAEVTAQINKELSGRLLQNSTLTYFGSAIKDVDVKDNAEIINK